MVFSPVEVQCLGAQLLAILEPERLTFFSNIRWRVYTASGENELLFNCLFIEKFPFVETLMSIACSQTELAEKI